ncbi:hypothetical protein FQN51_007792 [Onygenales sp. PD_10]|nr:hypothetical protein FQN51_007792 [Onygenales sp. PD_10]
MDEYKSTLEEEAEYGKLAFDIFALEKWNYTTPSTPTSNQTQWNTLVHQFLTLPAEHRVPYYLLAQPRTSNPTLPWPRPSAAQIARVLAPHQSIQERNVSARMNGRGSYAHAPPIWLRTGYELEMEGRYGEMVRAAGINDCEGVLDDAVLYGFGDGDGGDDAWRRRILLRLPQVVNTDVVLDDPGNEGEYRRTNFDVEWFQQGRGEEGEVEEDNDDDVSNPAFDVQIKLRNIIYLLDDEAIREGFIKVKWLGEYGDVVWENKLAPDEMGGNLIGGLASGLFLNELVDGGYFLD